MSDANTDRPAGMPCPRCRLDLTMSERQGIEIDYCPKCRGVWLDRGELDKIIERNAQFQEPMPPGAAIPARVPPAQTSAWVAPGGMPSGYPAAPPGWGQGHDPHGSGGYGGHGGSGHGDRRGHGSFLGRLFG